jgi:hypothetical protein
VAATVTPIEGHMAIWDKIKTPPEGALKTIQAGRLKGKSDINPQWRLQAMTELFGPVGIGWSYHVDNCWLEPASGGEVVAFAQVSIRFKHDGEWSEPIPGIGGNMMVEQESKGLHVNDECYKMAVTDALSVAMKALGMAADVYSGFMDGSKYSREPREDYGYQAPAPAGNAPTSVPSRRSENGNDLVVTWGKGDPSKNKAPSKWYGKKFSEVWAAGNEGHSYLHWVAEDSSLNAATKAAARAFIDVAKARAAAFATIEEIAAFKKFYAEAGLDVEALTTAIFDVDAKYGGIPAAWLQRQNERVLAKVSGVDENAPAEDGPEYTPEDNIGF